MKLDRFFKRRPGLLFAIRLAIFGGACPLLIWKCLEWGSIPMRGDRHDLHYAEYPIMFGIFIAAMAAGSAFAIGGSIVVFLKRKQLLAADWKPFGLDFRS